MGRSKGYGNRIGMHLTKNGPNYIIERLKEERSQKGVKVRKDVTWLSRQEDILVSEILRRDRFQDATEG